ncbi:hypothetical protein ANCCAN_09666 [Ancylostoma caninum]|uniref:NTR domain-containing protein n=1 Tax=Ancylostoma caninum TaxID=29170 RepID=A0A368GIY0_ANCCA|nr:hypothetical protein ANCCAN_09666 [Ancylostoma caninum]
MDSKMWSLVAFLTYVCVVHTETPQCRCQGKQEWDFIIEAEVSHIDESTSSDLTKYELTSTETYRTNNDKTIEEVYTNKGISPLQGPCPAKLEKGEQYVLKGSTQVYGVADGKASYEFLLR